MMAALFFSEYAILCSCACTVHMALFDRASGQKKKRYLDKLHKSIKKGTVKIRWSDPASVFSTNGN